MDKMREEFEVWVKLRGGYTMRRDKEYESSMTREWWQAWQASRQALVVELPRSFKDMYDQYVYDEQSIKDVLDNAGIKWTE